MARLFSKTAGGCLVFALVLSSLAGLVCADGPDDKLAMECCRNDAHHCNMPNKNDKTEDCCKPDRSSKNPASVESPFRSSIDIAGAPNVAIPANAVTAPDVDYRAVPFSPSRGSPRLLTNRPFDIPLLK